MAEITTLLKVRDIDGSEVPLQEPDSRFTAELASGARTSTYTGATKTNTNNARGVAVVLDLTAFTTAASLQVKIELWDPISAKWIDVLGTAAVTAIGTFIYIVAPNATAGAPVTKGVSMWLTRDWRISVTHGNANSHTYSVAFAYLK